MKRTVAVAAVSLIVLAPFLWTEDASARAGRGGSSGSRGSRSHSAPVHSPATTSSPAHSSSPAHAPSPTPASTPPSPSGGGGWGGIVGGLALGGLLGSLFSGGGGGFGFTGLVILGLLAFLMIRKMRSAEPEPGTAGSSARLIAARAVDVRDAPAGWEAESSSPVRRPEQAVDPAEVAQNITNVFLKVQAAWTARDMEPAAAILTPEMRAKLQADCDRMRGQGRVNRIENVTVRAVEVTETWQDPGYNFMTVRIDASLLDYTVDERTGDVLEGSATETVTFEEYWTLTRAVWVKAWRLSAIQQATT